MGREYVIQSWVKHDADDWRNVPDHLVDNGPGYSGEQVGNRAAKSNGNTLIRATVPGFLPNGKADIDGAADQADDAKGNVLLTIDPAFKVLLDYPGKAAALDKALKAKQITESLHRQALAILDAKQQKAQDKIDKLASEAPREEEEQEEAPPPPPLEEDAITPYKPSLSELKAALENYKNNNVY